MKPFKFAREVRAEAARVTWPTWSTTQRMTLVVLVFAGLLAIYLWLVDWIMSGVVRFLLSL